MLSDSVVAPKAYDHAMNAETFEAWLEHHLALPAASVSRRTTVLGSIWNDTPIVRPAKGFDSSKAEQTPASKFMRDRIHSTQFALAQVLGAIDQLAGTTRRLIARRSRCGLWPEAIVLSFHGVGLLRAQTAAIHQPSGGLGQLPQSGQHLGRFSTMVVGTSAPKANFRSDKRTAVRVT